MRAEGIPSDAVQVAGQPADAGKHFHRRDVQVRTFATPSLNDGVDLVPGWLAGHTRSLDGCERRESRLCRGEEERAEAFFPLRATTN
jgi:hypothetical protein